MKCKNKIICGDFRDYTELFQGDRKYIISDPPYNQRYHYSSYGDDMQLNEYTDMLLEAFSGYNSVVIHYPEETINVLSKAMYADWCEQSIAWVYNSNTGKQHRIITWWNCRPDMDRIKQPYKNVDDKRIAERILNGEQARLYDWWEINQVKNVSKGKDDHPCPIPYELAKKIIILTTDEGDTIIDPFSGSGTICKAAQDLKRNFIGIEISPEYCKIAEQRLKQKPLF